MIFWLLFKALLLSSYCQAHSLGDYAPQCSIPDESKRFDCFPESTANENDCINRGCCWLPHDNLLNMVAPFCYFPTNFPNYQVVGDGNVKMINDNISAISYNIQKNQTTFRPNEILNLSVDIIYDTQQRLRVRIYDPNRARYEVPLNVEYNKMKSSSDDIDYYVNVIDNPFAIRVFRKSNNKLIFDTSVAPLLYADQFIQFSTLLPNNYIYGIGEHRDSFQHVTNWTGYSIWTRDQPPDLNENLYGAHPFYLCVEQDGNAMGFFLLNSNGMDVSLQPYPAISFITIGGILDFFIYTGPTPKDVISQHMMTIGLPFMPPYFALGFHLCRYGYLNEENLQNVIHRNRAARIPYDTQWTDIDVMDNRLDWTYSNQQFPHLVEIVADLHQHGQHYINIIDPGIAMIPGYPPFFEGLELNVFIDYYGTNQPLVGQVWPGNTVFPDFTNPNSTIWWGNQAKRYHETTPFDGLWIDMNEPSNFVDGSIQGCTNNSLDNPPYIPRIVGGELYSKTVCPSGIQYYSSHYNLHNMYGHFEAKASNEALKSLNKRPFVLSRSSYAGTGQYAAHWSGDNLATWSDLYYSIPSILNFNMFGVTMIGADVCGFRSNTTEELCTRWMQLGSFYPFMRNHNDLHSMDQDPASFSEQAVDIMRTALKTRYLLLPYTYTLFYQSHTMAETVARPLLFEYPTDFNTHSIDQQFMFGPALLVSPVLIQSATTVNAYFPNDTWYDFYTGEQIQGVPSYIQLDAPISKINVHVRGGYIIPMQHPEVTTTLSRRNPFELLVALNDNSSIPAYGSLFWDDGETIDTVQTNFYNIFEFYAVKGKLQVLLDKTHRDYNTQMILDTINVYGVKDEPSNVTINNESYNDFVYDDIYKTLKIQYLHLDMYQLGIINANWY